ncbi:hypothetical protein like AT3G43660 [Hibiscus trionum]|uniref:Vacuolar iron transporter n=1 Tax=Hibiscus trionum TaxID=183268 RepID=A0A9W7J1I9_HIBTR|nr:hypothetical protein like AT3G43660 [Hibiscus trionum]
MAASQTLQLSPLDNVVVRTEENQFHDPAVDGFDYSQRGQWLRAAVLGANDGLVSVASLMMGVGSVKEDANPMVIAGFAGLVAGACSMAIGEFVSVCTQRDVEMAQMKREKRKGSLESGSDEKLPNPAQAAVASALAFAVGAVLPLLAAAFIRQHKVRIAVVVLVASVALVVFGVVAALLGGTPVAKSSARVLVGGWMAMGTTFGLTRLIGSDHGMQV